MRFGELHRLQAVLRLGDDLELGPDLGEPRAQLLAHQALVIGDEGAGGQGERARRVHAFIVAPAPGLRRSRRQISPGYYGRSHAQNGAARAPRDGP